MTARSGRRYLHDRSPVNHAGGEIDPLVNNAGGERPVLRQGYYRFIGNAGPRCCTIQYKNERLAGFFYHGDRRRHRPQIMGRRPGRDEHHVGNLDHISDRPGYGRRRVDDEQIDAGLAQLVDIVFKGLERCIDERRRVGPALGSTNRTSCPCGFRYP